MFVYQRPEKILMVEGQLPDDANAKVLIDLSEDKAKVFINGRDATSGGTPVPPPTPETAVTETEEKGEISFGDKQYSYNNPSLTVQGLGTDSITFTGEFAKIEENEKITAWGFPEEVKGVVVIKLTIDGIKKGEAEGFELKIQTDQGTNTYDQTALDGDDYIYIGWRNDRKSGTITVRASAEAKEKVITITNNATLAE